MYNVIPPTTLNKMKGPAQYEPNTQEERDEGSEDLFKPEGETGRSLLLYYCSACSSKQNQQMETRKRGAVVSR